MIKQLARWILRDTFDYLEARYWTVVAEKQEAYAEWRAARSQATYAEQQADFYKTQLYREREIHLRVMQDAERAVGRRLS